MNMLMTIWAPQKAGSFLASSVTISFSTMILLH